MLSDEQLIAYLADTLAADERAQVEAALVAEPETLRRLIAHEGMEQALRAHFSAATAIEQAKAAVMADVLDVPHELLRKRVVAETRRENRGQKLFNWSAWREQAPSLSGWQAVALACSVVVIVSVSVAFWLTRTDSITLSVQPQPQTQTVARLSDVGAGVVIVRAGSEIAAQNGFELRDGDTLKVGEGAATVVYPDATRLLFGANSRLKLGGDGKQISCDSANLVATVSKQPEGKPLVLLTPQAIVTVVGTVFSLWVDADRTWLIVSEGLVRLTNVRDQKSVIVAANQFAVAAREAELRPLPQEEIYGTTHPEKEKLPHKFGPHGPPMIPHGLRKHGPPNSPPGLQKQHGENKHGRDK